MAKDIQSIQNAPRPVFSLTNFSCKSAFYHCQKGVSSNRLYVRWNVYTSTFVFLRNLRKVIVEGSIDDGVSSTIVCLISFWLINFQAAADLYPNKIKITCDDEALCAPNLSKMISILFGKMHKSLGGDLYTSTKFMLL